MGNNYVQSAVQTRSKSLTKTIVGVAIFALVASIVTGGYAALGSYSAATGANLFKMTAKPDHAGGGKGGGDKAGLEVSLSNEIYNQSVVAGTKQHAFARIILDASVLDQDVQVNELNFTVMTDNQVSPSEVSNFRILNGNTQLATTNDPDSDTSGKVNAGESAIVKFNLINPVVVPRGAISVLTVKADISSVASGVYQVGITQPAKKSKVKVVDANYDSGKLSVNYQYSNGAEMNVVSSGVLSVSQHHSSPKTGLIPGNTSGVTLTTLNLRAHYEDVYIEKIYFTGRGENGGGWDQIDRLYLYQGATLLRDVTPTSTDSNPTATVLVDMTGNPVVVSKDSQFSLTLKADTAGVNGEVGSNGSSFEGISVGINSASDVVAKGVSSGSTITDLTVNNSFGYPQYLVRSTPVITPNDDLSSGLQGGVLSSRTNEPLYRFSVTANSAGDVGLYYVTFWVNKENVDVSGFQLRDEQGSVLGSTLYANENNEVGIYLTSTSTTLTGMSTIGAGNTKTYTLSANISCTAENNCNTPTSSGAYLAVQLLGDTRFSEPVPAQVSGPDSSIFSPHASNLGWTDFWMTPILQSSDPDVFTETQWSNGYLVAEADGGTLAPTSTAVTFYR